MKKNVKNLPVLYFVNNKWLLVKSLQILVRSLGILVNPGVKLLKLIHSADDIFFQEQFD